MATTEATVPDCAMLTPVHQQLEERQLLPGEHLVDSGEPSAELIMHVARVFGITLVSPLRLDNSAEARAAAGMTRQRLPATSMPGRRPARKESPATWNPCRSATS